MQNKGLVKFFAIIFALVSIYQLSFTFVTSHYEKKAKEFAQGDSAKELQYLDSIGGEKVFLGQTFNEVRAKQINKGLDLEGGVNVTLQISVKDILKGLANHSKNAVFNKALAEAENNRQGNQNYLDAFYVAFDKESKGTVRLASPEIFANRNLSEVTIDMSDNQVKAILNRQVKESIESAYKVLRERIDKFGVTQPNIQMIGDTGRILVELPGAKDVDRVKNLLQSTAQLEFWETYKVEEVGNFILAANQFLKENEAKDERIEATVEKAIDTVQTEVTDVDKLLSGVSADSVSNSEVEVNPLLDLFVMMGQQGSPVIGYFNIKDTVKVNAYLKKSDVRSLLPAELRYARFAWGKPSRKTPDMVELYALKTNRDGVPPLSGSAITGAQDGYDHRGRPSVSMQMNAKGAKVWEQLTGKAFTEQSNIAIVLDNIVYSAPGVSSGPISGGSSEITGDFSVADTKDLANILKAGKLPASADIVQSEIVGPSLGQQAIDNGTMSAVGGLLIVFVWMVLFYGRAGWFANIALLVNILFLFGVLASLGAVLTLPGIAGIVLTIGTAIDANIIIYERAKEALRRGEPYLDALKEAYSWKGAMSAITDANVTTAITGFILLMFGTGPIKGFATTLLIGIATSLFTAIFVTRFMLDWAGNKGKYLTFTNKFSKNLFVNMNFDFIGKKKISYTISAILVIVSVGSLFINGMDQGTDFVGGRTFQVRFEKPVVASEVSSELSRVFDSNVEAKVFGNSNQLKITTKYKVEEESAEVDAEVNHMLYDALKKYFDDSFTYENFVTSYDGKNAGILQATKVGPSVAKDVKTDAYWAVIGAISAVFIYLIISFRKWQYSFATIVAVVHDVIVILGVYSLCYKFAPFNMEVDQSFIAAILTVIGYSLNDSVIIFDRVREFFKSEPDRTTKEVVNHAINATLSRTFNTSVSIIVVLLVMFIFGGEAIRGFIFAMFLGIFVGTYSSIFLATPIMVDTVGKNRLYEEKKEE